MFLRSLTLKGFKSFADKTTLEFVPGVSVIVGPNGSGKSNLVDAISWVLGEQGVRSLRGGQMADVIFAGSPKRPGLGMAEVQLVIDNEAGMIPVPMSELQISRGVFRSGDSEYRIGSEIRRLMDIQELLSDSGIGRALHTIVGQGQLDEVLTARPEDRRQFIEEAAGIAKHRRRKERAQRKLSSLDQDLLRLQDVLQELRRQLKPLRQQAEMAKKHEKLTTEADDGAWRLAAARLRGLLKARESKRPGWEQGLEARAGAKRRIEELDVKIDALTGARERTVAALAEAEAELHRAQEAKTAAEVSLRDAREREADAKVKLASEAARTMRLDTLRDEIARGEHELHALADELARCESEMDAAEAEFREAEQVRREAEDERRRLTEEAASHRAEVETVRRSLEAYERDRARLDETLAAARERVAAAQTERDGLDAEIERQDARAMPLQEQRGTLDAERARLSAQLAELEEALHRHRSAKEVLEARQRDLKETPGTRFIEANPGRGAGLLRDLVRAERGWERALIAALGPFADAVVYEDRGRAIADAPGGKGAVIAVPSGQAAKPSLDDERSITSVVRADPRAGAIVAALLRDVYLADDVRDGEDRHSRHPRASFVTKDGILVGPVAIHTASEHEACVRAIAGELGEVSRELAAAESAVRPVRRRIEDLERESSEVAEELREVDVAIAAAAEQMGRLGSDLAAATKEEEMVAQRLVGMDEAAAVWRETLAAAELSSARSELPSLPPAPEPPITARVAMEGVRRDRAALQIRLEHFRGERDVLMAESPEQLRANADASLAQREPAETAFASAEESYTAAVSGREQAAVAEREATTHEAETNRAWREAAAELDRLREAYEEDDRARGDLERRIADAERLLQEGHQRDPQEAVASLSEDDTIESLERKSELVARRMQLLGKVNLLAGGEFEALQERHDFMHRELEDIKKARRDLLDVIRRVDDEVVQLFDTAFRDVAREFEAMFEELFPGGEGRLILTDPANLLETGIEVEARPGKKRVKRLSLLSGGERALTALGFLFSIFKARPSPFYLLDEVEASLDDVNLHRFLGLIKGFAQESQVIIVTHQKRTMEIADTMYGVSMDQDGSTRVVCQSLDDPGAQAPDSPAAMVSETEPVN